MSKPPKAPRDKGWDIFSSMTQPNHKGGNMIFDGNNTNEPTVYAVGLLRDWKMYRNGNRSLKTTLYWFSKSWARRSYYNGYLAETEDKHRCGRGWTRKAALRSWAKIPRETPNDPA